MVTSGVFLQEAADGFSVLVDAVDAGDEVTAITLEEEGVFTPVVVFEVGEEGGFELFVEVALRIQDRAGEVSGCGTREGVGPTCHP